ncbi:MAG: hypothetical protein HRT35_07665 [Algicola sp.]|nr:hypothetical protein [Algicola sp.]
MTNIEMENQQICLDAIRQIKKQDHWRKYKRTQAHLFGVLFSRVNNVPAPLSSYLVKYLRTRKVI